MTLRTRPQARTNSLARTLRCFPGCRTPEKACLSAADRNLPVPQRRFRHPVVLAPDALGRRSAIVDPEFARIRKAFRNWPILITLCHIMMTVYEIAILTVRSRSVSHYIRTLHLQCLLSQQWMVSRVALLLNP